MNNMTPRFALPQLAVSQAQKEITHNEALAIADALLHPVVEEVLAAPPPVGSVDAGKCWIVGSGPTGSFTGKADQLAYWTGSAWRFIVASDGMRVWHRGNQLVLRYIDQLWEALLPVALPTGGTVIDIEARAAIAAIVDRMTSAGIFSPN
jgi:Protein of unknown function (DUF2793)